VLIQIGDEILSYTSITGTTIGGVLRGRNGTIAENHLIGSTITVLSGRPDGLFSDQIAFTDILDLRHVVNPNGFDYKAVLQSNLDKLVRGQLRSNWKRSGSGCQGSFIFYEDEISASPAGLGVTSLDAPDRVRMVYSDAAMQQPVEVICTPYTSNVVTGAQSVTSNWALNVISAVTTRQDSSDAWTSEGADLGSNADPTTNNGDLIVIPVSGFKSSVSGGDSDQVRLLNEVPVRSASGVSSGTTTFTDSSGVNYLSSNVEVGDSLVIFYGLAKGTYSIVGVSAGSITTSQPVPSLSASFYEIRKGSGSVQIRLDGQSEYLPQHRFVVSPSNTTFSDDLTIQFVGVGAPFPILKSVSPNLYLTVVVQYGAGRGLARVPNSLHNITLYNPYEELLVQPSGVPSNNFPLRTSWALLWSKYRNSTYKGLLPVTTEAYADLGSKTVILTPYQRVNFPTSVSALNGAGENPYTTPFISSTSTGLSGSVLNDSGANFTGDGVVAESDLLVIHEGPAKGTYVVKSRTSTALNIYGSFPTIIDYTVSYSVYHTQGLMPLNSVDGVTSKWVTTDPLNYFSGTTDSDPKRKNFYVTLPRHLVPSWGAVYIPTLPANNANFHRGVNFLLQSHEGDYTALTNADHNNQYINYTAGSPFSYAAFSTGNFSGVSIVDSVYNATFSYGGGTFAGTKLFSDTRGLGRKGIQFPPFYGLARLWAVYEALDYKTNGPSFSLSTRSYTGSGAVNLLRQNFDGPVYWIELDADGDSYFVLNADALDLTKAGIETFESAHYVVTASIFGFDRGSFDSTKPFKMVLSRSRSEVNSQGPGAIRQDNIDNATISGPWAILPGPLTGYDTALINYSRTPYQGDPWGSQSNYSDTGYSSGPLSSSVSYQLGNTELNLSTLTRPNQKALEVLASTGFITTLGTGRLSGDVAQPNSQDFRNVGYEEGVFPPLSPTADRPTVLSGALDPDLDPEVSSDYLGCTERLPLGALYLDKDFKGGRFSTINKSPFLYCDEVGIGSGTSGLANYKDIEQSEVSLAPPSTSVGLPGNFVVQVDGELGSYGVLTNFRTHRGGSMFVGSGDRPGGELFASYSDIQGSGRGSKALVGRAYLVRNAPTYINFTKVSAGDELMLAVVTSVVTLGTSPEGASILIGTNGSGEGESASELYRIEGRPLVANRSKYEVDPSAIVLPTRV